MNTKLQFATFTLVAFAGVGRANSSEDSRPKNILFLAVDDLKPLLGCYGDDFAITPNIDKLAAEGALFERAYCQQAISGPSRASLLTGMRPDQSRVWDLQTLIRDMHPDVVTLPQHFKESGYFVEGIGKIYDFRSVDKHQDSLSWSTPYINCNDYLNANYPEPVLYDYQNPDVRKEVERLEAEALAAGVKRGGVIPYIMKSLKPSTDMANVPDDAYHDGATAIGAIEMIRNAPKDKPFFIAAGFKKPHLPFTAPTKYWDMYNREDIELAAFREEGEHIPDIAYHNSGELSGYSDIKSIAKRSAKGNLLLPEDKQRELLHGYYASTSYTDAQIGLIVDALKEMGLDKSTIIVLWGDHGWHLGDHNLWCKHSNFEQATRVPFIIVDPSSEPRRVAEPVELLDIYPTLCDMAGVASPAHLGGGSIRRLVERGECAVDDKPYALSQYPRAGVMGYSFRTMRYRYTVWVEWSKEQGTNFDSVKAMELYDYEVDALESRNLISEPEYQSVRDEMNIYWEEFASQQR